MSFSWPDVPALQNDWQCRKPCTRNAIRPQKFGLLPQYFLPRLAVACCLHLTWTAIMPMTLHTD